jgi:hypothetical protein
MRVTDAGRMSQLLPIVSILIVLIASFGCGGPPSQGDATQPESEPGGIPVLTKEVIDERINEAWVSGVTPETGTGNPISWSFDEDEPKELVVVDQQMDGNSAKIVLDVKTQSSPRATNQRVLAGQIRTEWELQTGWVLRRWEIVHTENISMKYKDVPKASPPPVPNSNQPTPGNNR